MVALGGGVIGDLTGFAAASWLRGIRFVQVPTSLLAMVDSSVGGKTGINIAEGKNLVGAFHQPELVWMDLETLATLPERELKAGLAEIVKTGIIWDEELFQCLEKECGSGILPLALSASRTGSLGDGVGQRQDASSTVEKIISRWCEIKAEVVRQDEREGCLRGILNFGHTLAHAIENVAGYGEYLHGEAVAIGMIYAARLSTQLKGLSVEDSARIEKLLTTLGLSVDALSPQGLRRDKLAWNDLRAAMAVDKKTRDGQIKFVLVDRMGHAEIGCEIPGKILEEVWCGMQRDKNGQNH
jgi:3-dehydroquinate synthase